MLLEKKPILLTEDDDSVRTMVQRALSTGYPLFTEAGSLESAHELLQPKAFVGGTFACPVAHHRHQYALDLFLGGISQDFRESIADLLRSLPHVGVAED